MKLVGFVVVVGLASCTVEEEVRVAVDCTANARDEVECAITQKVGKAEAEACWDFAVTCANGTIVKAPRTCQKVKQGGTEKLVIPKDRLRGLAECDGGAKAEITNLTVNGQRTSP